MARAMRNVMILTVIAAPAVLAAEPAFGDGGREGVGSFETEAFYARASYVGGIREDVCGLEVRWVFRASRWSIRAALPLLSASNAYVEEDDTASRRGAGSLSFLRSGGDPPAGAAGSGALDPGPGGRGRDGSGPGPHGQGPHVSEIPTLTDRETGAGDLRLQISRRVGDDAGWHRFFLRGGVKIPTADEDRALGSGEADYWAGISWRRQGWTADLSAHLDYERLGDPEDYRLQDGPGGGFFVEWPFQPRGLFVGAVANHPVYEGESIRASGVAGLWGPMGPGIEWSLEASAGLTGSAPDFGISLTMRM